MLNLPTGVTLEQWIAAQSILPDAWQPGRRCEGPTFIKTVAGRYARCEHGFQETHDVSPPAVTDASLMAILREGLGRDDEFLLKVDDLMMDVKGTRILPFEAAIILAGANLKAALHPPVADPS